MWTDDECRANGLTAVVVARGRTVRTGIPGSGEPDPNDPRRVIGTTSRKHGPGETVWLPPSEAARLRAIGFVLDPQNADDAQAIAALLAPPPAPDAPRRVTPEPQQILRFNTRSES